jgi:hypothetical protein
MKINAIMLLVGTVAAEGMLWLVAPGLATMAGVVLGLFAIASQREGARIRNSRASNSFSVDDFQRRLDTTAV